MTTRLSLLKPSHQDRLCRIHYPTQRAGFVPFTGVRPSRRQPSSRARSTAKGDDTAGGDGGLGSVFNQFVLVKGISSPAAAAQRAHPSPLMPPTAVLEQTMTVLQRNDWPEADAGVLNAFHLTMPSLEDPSAVRSWRAEQEWLPWPRFHALLHVAFGPLLNCDSWRVVSPLVFPSSRHDNRAVQAVEVRAAPRQRRQPQAQAKPQIQAQDRQQQELEGDVHGVVDEVGAGAAAAAGTLRSYTYTFCLERQESGPYKDCWLIGGVRVGNYAL